MTNIGDGFKNIFMAGIGALAYVAKGEITLDQGRELNEELQRKAVDATNGLRESALEARMKAMTPEERDEFVKLASQIAATQNEADASQVVEAEVVEAEDAADEAEKPADEA